MVQLEQLAGAALSGDALVLRSLAQDWLRENPTIRDVAAPVSIDEDVIATAAGLVELFALRSQPPPPPLTANVGSARQPIFLVKAARTMHRLREMCVAESPLPLRRRGLYAPANFLSFA